MTTRSSIGSKTSPRAMFSHFVKSVEPAAPARTECPKGGGCGGACRAGAITRLNREGMSACQAGDYGSAGRLLEEGIALAARTGTAMYEAKLRNNLGLVHLLAERHAEAAGQFWQALELVEGKLGRDNTLFKRIEGNLLRASGH